MDANQLSTTRWNWKAVCHSWEKKNCWDGENRKMPYSFQIFLKNFLSLFIYFDREKESRGGAEREGESENTKEAMHCQHRARCRAQTHEP